MSVRGFLATNVATDTVQVETLTSTILAVWMDGE
jgi:hypothetical protein